ncbi:FKBP-type peptidyl-prolyl cis-trans isomerase [Actinomadura viridis]|uniref:peptidylprolyl isomerase n=1 Tax=Actinomadura viridis TaxID=58110 RepID=A0A931DBQ8_9ACTN|nr:FKBP-type peptidyl-prolyl cis-trans isomerase [Actinomadura viridis]MBG6086107.1 peptidylprolyl isomerase [Actinomadura viridis]
MSEDDKPRGERAVKAKLPNAKNIRSPEFTPHGISGGSRSRGPRPSGKTAAQAKRQRRVTIALVAVAVLAIAGGTTYYATRPGPVITATGALGQAPKVTIPKDLVPAGKLSVDTEIKGTGEKIANGDTAMVKFAFYQWSKGTDEKADESTNKKLESSWERPAGQQVVTLTVGNSGVKGLDKGLVGQTPGSRLILRVPPAEGFGQQGSQLGLAANDWVVFVVDVLANYAKNAEASGTEKKLDDEDLPKVEAGEAGKGPKVTIPKVDPPSKMQVKTLIEGTGPVTTKDDTAVVNYKGLIWRDGKQFDSSWEKGQPATFPLNSTEGMTGFFKGLQGQKVGSRVLLVLPPKDGYGKEGNPQAGIKGTDHAVFVVDILGTMPK